MNEAEVRASYRQAELKEKAWELFKGHIAKHGIRYDLDPVNVHDCYMDAEYFLDHKFTSDK